MGNLGEHRWMVNGQLVVHDEVRGILVPPDASGELLLDTLWRYLAPANPDPVPPALTNLLDEQFDFSV